MNTPITMVGTIGTVPERRKTTNGTIVCRFRLACSERRYDRENNTWADGDPNWLTIIAYRGLAEHAHASFNKGDRVLVSGRLRVRPWQNDEGKSGLAVEVEADALGHDLRWGTSEFTRSLSAQGSEGRSPDTVALSTSDSEAGERDDLAVALDADHPSPFSEHSEESGTMAEGALVGASAAGAPF